MPKSRKRSKKKHKRKYGQQDKVVFRRVVRQTMEQERPLTLKEKVVLFRNRQQAGQESAERIKSIRERVTPPGMSFSEYLQYIEKKKEEAREKGAHFRY